ncbi:MAG: STAS/SEC14 domain-containing protein [Acidobacteriota bacterium]|nr:STAS/SEC14 domain-containing protein [Acidobacteriota bacterium]
MIERLRESSGGVLGFKVTGKMTDEDLKHFEPQIEFLIAERKHKPISILADLSAMKGAELAARWDEMRFLQKHTDHIARMAVVGASKWEEMVAIFTAGAAVLQAETRYFDESQTLRAWEWVRTSKHAEDEPIQQISAGTGIWKDYHPEWMDL